VTTRRADRVRVMAARILARWQRERRHVEALVDEAERDLTDWDHAERRRLRELVYSPVRLRARYDHIVARRSRRAKAPAPELRAVFWIALHELIELQHKPHAVVDEAVRMTGGLGVGYAGGFVNGMLRSLLRDGLQSDFPNPADGREWAATWLSHPRWMVDRWARHLGESEMLELCAANNERPKTFLRSAPGARGRLEAELSAMEWESEPVEFLPDGLRLRTSVPPALLLAQLEQSCTIQDAAAQLVAPLLAPARPRLVLDACAAPGGKLTHLSALLPEARCIGADLRADRLRSVGVAIERLALAGRAQLVVADATCPPFADGTFDAVLLDAPCTGTGVLARRHDARWHRRPEDPVELAALQRVLLDRALDLVRPGGVVLYATCSLEPEENDEVVDFVLTRRDDVREWPVDGEVEDRFVSQGRLATWPHRHGIDGAFAARLRRNPNPGSS
jgi:16S rRNA (cytosine967-C5)-methyltransferase